MNRRAFLAVMPGIFSSLAQTRAATDFTLPDLEGNIISLSQFKANVVLLEFWATWCEPCIAEIPTLNSWQEKYRDRGFKLLAITLESGSARDVEKQVAKRSIGYTVLMGNDAVSNRYNISGFPTRYLITRDGKIHRRFLGIKGDQREKLVAEIEREIQLLLANE